MRRGRDAGETRARILSAAQRRFSSEGYDHVGLREIASGAGVDAALVIRYFGSKEALFAEAIRNAFDAGDLVGDDRAGLGDRLARLVLSRPAGGTSAKGFDPLQLLLRSANSPTASGMVASGFDESFVRPLAERLGGPDAELRAGLMTSYMIGVLIMRLVLRTPSLPAEETERAAAILAAALQACVEDPPPPG